MIVWSYKGSLSKTIKEITSSATYSKKRILLKKRFRVQLLSDRCVKAYIMRNQNTTKSSKEDQVWDLLLESKPKEASSSFSQNVLREARLSGSQESPSWFSQLMIPQVALPVCAVFLFTFILTGLKSNEESEITIQTEQQESEVEATSETWYNEALFSTAIENPELFSDEELVAMIF